MKTLTLLLLAALFVSSGIFHFIRPLIFEAIVPPYLPSPRFLVLFSGAAEVAGGLGLLLPSTRRAAGWGLIALLLAVFPANFHMWQNGFTFNGSPVPNWILLARLPLQFVLIALVFWSTQPKKNHPEAEYPKL